VSIDAIPVADDIEDTATNAAAAGQRIDTITDNLLYILAVELTHAAQTVNLRQPRPPARAGTRQPSTAADYRTRVPFLDKDRLLSIDVKKSYDFLRKLRQAERPPTSRASSERVAAGARRLSLVGQKRDDVAGGRRVMTVLAACGIWPGVPRREVVAHEADARRGEASVLAAAPS
jgi:hypothetical protein